MMQKESCYENVARGVSNNRWYSWPRAQQAVRPPIATMLEQTGGGGGQAHAGATRRRGRAGGGRDEQHSLAAALPLDWRRRRVLVLRRERDGVALLELLRRGAGRSPVGPHRLSRDEPVDLLEDRLEGRAHVAVGQGGSLDEEEFVLKSKKRAETARGAGMRAKSETADPTPQPAPAPALGLPRSVAPSFFL